MKKIFTLVMLCAGLISAAADNSGNPQWLQALLQQNQDIIDSTAAYDAHPSAPGYRTYVIFFHQPLEHANPGLGQFPMRALITVNTNNDPTTAVNHFYCTGYSINYDCIFRHPDSTFLAEAKMCSSEISHRYNANFIQIEHRYFQFSAPYQCWTNLDYLRADEAAEDFHNLAEALKKVLKGKWVMSGVSKGGITTLLQHAFYPNDMDIYVPYSAPFFRTDRDTVMQEYWYTHGWDQELLDWFMSVRRAAFEGAPALKKSTNTIWPIFYKMNAGKDTTQAYTDTVFCAYISNAAYFGFLEHAYTDTATIRKQFAKNDSILRSYNWNGYNDTVLAYIYSTDRFALDSLGNWLDTLRKYPDKKQIPGRRLVKQNYRPFGIAEKYWWDLDDPYHTGNAKAYEYQAKRELGSFDFRYDLLAPTPEEAAWYNNHWKTTVGCLRDFTNPYFASLTYSPALYDRVMEATQNATKPIILIYGEDDTWTGAAVKDEFVNGSNVKKFILPAQNHLACFSSNTDKPQCDAIRAAIDAVLGAPQGVDQVPSDQVPSTKVLRNGQLLIKRGEAFYTLTGNRVN